MVIYVKQYPSSCLNKSGKTWVRCEQINRFTDSLGELSIKPALPGKVKPVNSSGNCRGLHYRSIDYNAILSAHSGDVGPLTFQLDISLFAAGPNQKARPHIEDVKPYQIRVEEVDVAVYRKRIRHLYLRVGPPDGHVRVSAPLHIDDESIRRVVVKRMPWILRQQQKHRIRGPDIELLLVSGEQHYVEGLRVRLNITIQEGPPSVYLVGESTLEMRVRSDTDLRQRRDLLSRWYRQRLQSRVPALIAMWEPVMDVKVREWRIRKMKTRWGSCNFQAGRIWLSLELAKKPMHCLEYVIVHEMAHLIEPSHNRRFWGILDRLMPNWRTCREDLNRVPDAGQTA